MNDFFKKTNLYQHRLFRLMVFILLFFCASIWSEAGYALQCWSSFNRTSLSTDTKVVIPYTLDKVLSKNASTTKGSITVTCSFAASEQSATVCSQLAATKNDTDTFRIMTDSNNNTVLFNVYTDVNYTNIWGYKSGGNAQYPKSFSINNTLVAKLTNTNYLK